jgi:type VI protein secretion system component VasA
MSLMSFDYLVRLMLRENEFRESAAFGTMERTEQNGVLRISTSQTPAEVLQILKYSAMEVFACADQIICTHKGSVLDYCAFHLLEERLTTYEEYIHVVACQALLKAKFSPEVAFPPVPFCSHYRGLQKENFSDVKDLFMGGDADDTDEDLD